MSLFDDVKKNLIEWYTVTSEKTSEVARITSRRYDKFGISRDIERQFGELGSLIHSGLREGRGGDLLQDAAVQELVARIDELESELRAKDDEIEAIKDQYRARKAAAGAVDEDVVVLRDPALGEGTGDSAILIEPEADAGGSDAGAADDPEQSRET